LALLSDAGHMLTDVIGVGMALSAILLARRAVRQGNRTFGMYRAEVLAALGNATLLLAVAGYVLYTAAHRFANPPAVPGLPVIATALVGLLVNTISLIMLRAGAQESLNLRGAYLEVLADLVGSFGVLVSGALTLLFGWRYADPIVAVGIGLFVIPRTLQLAGRALHILFQHAPEGIDVTRIDADLGRLPGVAEVHDLHVWTLTSGMEVASAHLTTKPGVDHGDVLLAAQRLLAEGYRIEHATLQVEAADRASRCGGLSW
jgi:cobalt-zinc-cadmium efflux system protein